MAPLLPPNDHLELLPRGDWPEPWRSMDAGPPGLPNHIPDPEVPAPPVTILVVPARDPHADVLNQVRVDLRTVQHVWEGKASPKPQDRRIAVWSSVKILSDHIEAVLPDGHELVTHLLAIRTALVDLQAGRAVDWLLPATIGGRPAGVRVEIGNLRGRYASIVELLYREGRSVRDAARDVKKLIPSSSPVWASGSPSWEAVKRWRDYDIKIQGSAEKAGYEAGLALAARSPGLTPAEILRRMS